MSAVERAGDVLNDAWQARHAGIHWPGGIGAKALADAGLLVTDADQAVLAAAEAVATFNDKEHICEDYDTCCFGAEARLIAAVRARREAH